MRQLREETRQEHELTESAFDLAQVTESVEAYRAVVARNFGFYAAFEPHLWRAVPWSELQLSSEERRKAGTLRADLTALGFSEAEIEALPTCDRLPSLVTPERAIGAMYVLEGSTLGGQIIGREIDRRLGLSPENGAAFFASYAAQIGTRWRAFGAAVERYAEAGGDINGMINGARATFSAYRDWLLSRPA